MIPRAVAESEQPAAEGVPELGNDKNPIAEAGRKRMGEAFPNAPTPA
jgi:hypothetical protein